MTQELIIVIFPIWGNRREGDHPQSHTVGAELNINSIDKVFTSAIAIITYRNTTIAIYVISFNVRILQLFGNFLHFNTAGEQQKCYL